MKIISQQYQEGINISKWDNRRSEKGKIDLSQK